MKNVSKKLSILVTLGLLASCSSDSTIEAQSSKSSDIRENTNAALRFGLLKDGDLEFVTPNSEGIEMPSEFNVSLRCVPNKNVEFWDNAYNTNPLKDANGGSPKCKSDGTITQKVSFKYAATPYWKSVSAVQQDASGRVRQVSAVLKINPLLDAVVITPIGPILEKPPIGAICKSLETSRTDKEKDLAKDVEQLANLERQYLNGLIDPSTYNLIKSHLSSLIARKTSEVDTIKLEYATKCTTPVIGISCTASVEAEIRSGINVENAKLPGLYARQTQLISEISRNYTLDLQLQMNANNELIQVTLNKIALLEKRLKDECGK